jgi:hypothetical protein
MSDLKQRAWSVIQKMDGWAGEDRCSTLIDLILEHKPKVSVEIGVYGGRSLAAIGIACQHLGSGFVWGVDPWSVEAAIEGESEANVEWWSKLDIEAIYVRFIQNIIAMQLTKECRWIRARADEVVTLFQDNSINLFSLDGNHSELASCREVTMWLPKIAPQGVIVMDDTDWASQAKAIQMIRAAGLRTIRDAGNWMAFQKP